MFQRDTTKQKLDNARHRKSVGEEVAGIRAECNEAGLNLRELRQNGMLECQGHKEAERNP